MRMYIIYLIDCIVDFIVKNMNIVTGYSLGNFGSSYNGYGGYGGYRPFGFNQDREPNPLVRQAEVITMYNVC